MSNSKSNNRTVVGSEDVTIGLGGQLQNGGHGLLSNHHGLSSDQVYQATIITSNGTRLTANDEHNQDIIWAIRGAGGGQFGIVTEFVLQTHPVPENLVAGALRFFARDNSNGSESASWAALAEAAAQFPELMDEGITGTMDSITGKIAVKYVPGLKRTVPGPAVVMTLESLNSTTERMNHTLNKLVTHTRAASGGNMNITIISPSSYDCWTFTKLNFLSSNFAGSCRMFSS